MSMSFDEFVQRFGNSDDMGVQIALRIAEERFHEELERIEKTRRFLSKEAQEVATDTGDSAERVFESLLKKQVSEWAWEFGQERAETLRKMLEGVAR